MQNVTMIRGMGFSFRNVDRFNLSAFNVIHSTLGIHIYCLKDYSSNGLVDYSDDEAVCSTGEITGAVALNSGRGERPARPRGAAS